MQGTRRGAVRATLGPPAGRTEKVAGREPAEPRGVHHPEHFGTSGARSARRYQGARLTYSRSRPAISACHGATVRSTKPISQFSPIAITIKMMIGTNIVAVSKLFAELMITAPRPEMVVKNSAITIATT